NVGGYDDWLRNSVQSRNAQAEPKVAKEKSRQEKEKPRKLTFKEERELEALPEQIAVLEAEQAALHARLADPEFYKNAGAEVTVVNDRLAALEAELEGIYGRWEELESLKEHP
ncbi:MAG TPA: ABC transporter ATP-binding protein, partial [Dongiaceae bacterium]|nr:ABC transporter ATP-binding protein [Dongiaceae bacterium]